MNTVDNVRATFKTIGFLYLVVSKAGDVEQTNPSRSLLASIIRHEGGYCHKEAIQINPDNVCFIILIIHFIILSV